MSAAWARHLPDGMEPAGIDLLAQGSLPAAWRAQWRAEPAAPAVRVHGEDGWLTRGALDERSAAVAGRLHATGLLRGDRVLLSGVSSAAFVVAHCAAMRAGYVGVPLNPDYSRREVEVIVADARPTAALVDNAEIQAWLAQIDPELVITGPEVALPEGPPPDLDDLVPSDAALLPYTSGTTGEPKGALLSHGNLLASAQAVRMAWRWSASDTLVLALPLFHMHGLGVGLHGTLLTGATAVVMPRFDPNDVVAAAADATMFFGVPTMYARLVETNGVSQLSRLRLCVSGSAPLSADLHERVRSVCGQVVLERYGMTETVMLVSNPYDGERRPGTVGFPLPGIELVLDETGEILVKGPNVFDGYWDRPAATQDAFTSEGWFRTGDIGALDADGYLRIVGRSKELIITGGYNVYPREVEDVLRAHPSVDDVAVVGLPSEEWGETVTAFVEVSGAFDPDELLAWAAARLAPYKRPRQIHRVETLPRNSLGKVVRSELLM